MCCDGHSYEPEPDEELGKCPDCAGEVIVSKETGEFYARVGCNWSPEICTSCGWRPCDDSC